MKSRTFKTFLFALLVTSFAFSQSRVKEKDVIGEWKFHLDLKKEIKEETKDASEFEKTLVKGIIGTVDKLVKKAEITFHFKKNHILEVTQRSLIGQEHETTETYKWRIDKKGRVITSQIDGDHITLNNDNGWMLKRGKLVSVDQNKDIEENVWMEKVK